MGNKKKYHNRWTKGNLGWLRNHKWRVELHARMNHSTKLVCSHPNNHRFLGKKAVRNGWVQTVVLFRFKLVPPSILVSFVRGGNGNRKKKNKGKEKKEQIKPYFPFDGQFILFLVHIHRKYRKLFSEKSILSPVDQGRHGLIESR